MISASGGGADFGDGVTGVTLLTVIVGCGTSWRCVRRRARSVECDGHAAEARAEGEIRGVGGDTMGAARGDDAGGREDGEPRLLHRGGERLPCELGDPSWMNVTCRRSAERRAFVAEARQDEDCGGWTVWR
jgi:hypothetical protein